MESGHKLPGASQEWHTAKQKNNSNTNKQVPSGKKKAKKMKNWTAPKKDDVHGFWIKHLTSLHPKIAQQLNRLLVTATIEE